MLKNNYLYITRGLILFDFHINPCQYWLINSINLASCWTNHRIKRIKFDVLSRWIGVHCRILLGIAFSLLIFGSLANSRSRESCGISNRRFLSIGGILCFIHGLFTIGYYVSVTATRREEKRQGNSFVGHT